MTLFVDRIIVPWLWFLADWSLRWGVVIAAIATWLALRPPWRAATRHLLCFVALIAGLLLCVSPRWETSLVVRHRRPASSASQRPLRVPRELDAQLAAPERTSARSSSGLIGNAEPSTRVSPPIVRGTAAGSPSLAHGGWRAFVLIAATVWASGTLVLLARLLAGQIQLQRLRRGGHAVAEGSLSLFDACRAALGLSRSVRLEAHPAVGSPIALGGLSPVVLVPPDWDSWPEIDRRACLMHELAHLDHNDDWAKLVQELVRAPFFFHPLVRWLLARLDRERELLCDEVVVGLGADPVAYARLLLDLARRPGRLLPDAAAYRPGWLPFLDRGTVATRIERLLEDDMPRSLSPIPLRRRMATGSLALAAALCVGGLTVRAVEPQAKENQRPSPAAVVAAVAQPQVRDSRQFEVAAVPAATGEVLVKVQATAGTEVKGPATVAPRELAGVVVDADGKPIEGVEVAAYHWIPKPPTATTDDHGLFRLPNLPEDGKIDIRLRKEGYETQYHERSTGASGWVAVLGNGTYFEGRVLTPDGTPVPGAPIRADAGPKRRSGHMQTETLSEAKSGSDGRYRLHVVPDQYDISVRMAGAGVARLSKEAIVTDQHRTLDIRLAPGVAFAARVVDRDTGKPAEGVRLWHWQRPGIEGTSNADGQIQIRDVPPGKYPRFQVEALGYARWWSDACLSEWSRYQKVARHGFQRNFDGLDFDIQPGMDAVTMQVERGTTVRGQVLDPDGVPVAGATVDPALTGSGNSLTGDTRFSVVTGEDGRFKALLPASGDIAYSLVAHDGKFREWRTWANGVVPPFKTTPGQVIEGLQIRLTRPGTVTGRVIDDRGNPVANREVRAEPTAQDENRYYDPTTKTGPDGTFTLKFVRPGEHYVQAAPFWLEARQAPEGTSRTVSVEAGQTVAGVELKGSPER